MSIDGMCMLYGEPTCVCLTGSLCLTQRLFTQQQIQEDDGPPTQLRLMCSDLRGMIILNRAHGVDPLVDGAHVAAAEGVLAGKRLYFMVAILTRAQP